MPESPLRRVTLEGPAAVYCSDNLWHVTIYHDPDDACSTARDLMTLGIAAPVYVTSFPRTVLSLANPFDPIQPEEP